jgi:hypothetical protein
MIRAEMDLCGHFFQGRSAVQLRHDVVDNHRQLSAGAALHLHELPSGAPAELLPALLSL